MPTIQLPSTSPSSLKRNQRISRRQRQRTETESTSTLAPQTTERLRRRDKSSTTQQKVRTSIHSTSPPVADRESSLYPHRVYASPVHDWSKSCHDLGAASFSLSTPTLDFYRFGTLASTGGTGTAAGSIYGNYHQQQQRQAVSVACLGVYNTNNTNNTTYKQSSASRYSLVRPGQWLESTLEDDLVDQDSEDCGYNTSTATETDLEHSRGSSLSDHSSSYNFDHVSVSSQKGDTVITPTKIEVTQRKGKWFNKTLFKLKDSKLVQKMASNNMASVPIVPARSVMRDAPIPKTRPEVMERGSSLYTLPMGPPLAQTPSLSSGSDNDVFDEATLHLPAGTAYRSPTLQERERGFFGKKAVAVERDPLKIKDGLEVKESQTGVYTPLTFPGACGPRPSHFPSHVYTPSTFQLYPTPSTDGNASAGPSRSSSTSSTSEVETPQTPISPTLRVFGNKTMAGLRRISDSLYSPSQTSSNRDSYFSYTSTSSRQSSVGPITPNSAHFPSGLGVGLTESGGITMSTSTSASTPADIRSRVISGTPSEETVSTPSKRPVEAPKGRRKPVPAVAQRQDSLEDEVDAEEELNRRMNQAHITHAI